MQRFRQGGAQLHASLQAPPSLHPPQPAPGRALRLGDLSLSRQERLKEMEMRVDQTLEDLAPAAETRSHTASLMFTAGDPISPVRPHAVGGGRGEIGKAAKCLKEPKPTVRDASSDRSPARTTLIAFGCANHSMYPYSSRALRLGDLLLSRQERSKDAETRPRSWIPAGC